MGGWQWFWTLVGFVVFIVVLIFLFFYGPFETLFTLVINGISFDNAIFWAALIIGIIGFCAYHWHAYRVHIVAEQSVESMVLSSLRGSTFTAILMSGGATLQAVQILCVYLLQPGYDLGAGFGTRLAAVVALVVLTGIFCVIFWLLKIIRPARPAGTAGI
ncbi:MAG TPA: hypothetical protein QGF63_00510 [Alphaproteobacteria bacterium]|jgi:hypothetical protein|nr:hypothetical protein [Alphaproteobacteria bacterium]HIJ92964.1 hypothetical protein [Rhodospirillaceae bacterium]HJM48305.1 hypothetical protein [Alphaproteobacteria bacterium]|tara:strand:+ start:246 stop:725 length:480 start_codon:yes stop_codon:yes gene_type:complete